MPIAIADSITKGEAVPHAGSTVFEFNPFEMGSYDPTIYGFVPLRYLGTRFVNGRVPDGETCYRGLDNTGFIMGTSATVFNYLITHSDAATTSGIWRRLLKDILQPLNEKKDDIASFDPNPFYAHASDTNPFADDKRLSLVDGGEDHQNLPFHPLLQPQRAVDVIFAVDASADTPTGWPNGSALVTTYERSKNNKIANGTAFPAIPDTNTFVNNGLNNKPTFFGCDAKNTSSTHTPIIVYLPSAPYSYHANISTATHSFENPERDAIIENAYNVATRGNATEDAQWPTCVSCVMLSRSWERTNTSVPAACEACFERYCWDGKVNTEQPLDYEPKLVMGN